MPTRLEFGDDLGAQELDAAHDLVVRQHAELLVAQQLVDTRALVAQDLLEAFLRRADDDHVLVGVPLDVDVALQNVLEQREGCRLLLRGQVGKLPLEDVLGVVLVPPVHGVPQPVVRLSLIHI